MRPDTQLAIIRRGSRSLQGSALKLLIAATEVAEPDGTFDASVLELAGRANVSERSAWRGWEALKRRRFVAAATAGPSRVYFFLAAPGSRSRSR